MHMYPHATLVIHPPSSTGSHSPQVLERACLGDFTSLTGTMFLIQGKVLGRSEHHMYFLLGLIVTSLSVLEVDVSWDLASST